LVRDGGGGTVQRIIFLGIDDEDAPEVRDLLGIRRELCQRLGVPLPTTLKTLPPHIAVHGPASADLHDDVVLDMLETRGKVLRGGGVVDAADTHRDNNRIRLAAIYAAWKRTPGTAVTVMLDDWYWADAVLEHSRRQRLSIIAAADSADTDEARTRGKLTGISQLTAAEERDRVEAARRDADVELVFSKLCARPGLKTRDFHNALSAPQRRGRKAIHMLRDAEDAGRVTENANGWWALDHDGNPITTPPKGNAR
jgi:hypothetical protein